MYVLDRLLALQLGRPMAIHKNDFDVIFPSRSKRIASYVYTDDNSEENGNVVGPTSLTDYFIHVIHFSDVVGLVIGELYQPNQKEISADTMLSCASSLDARLSTWKANLPRHLRFDLAHTFEKSIVFRRQVGEVLTHNMCLIDPSVICLPSNIIICEP
jgi:hypothetical protein